jgi:signal transduction histidine kinase
MATPPPKPVNEAQRLAALHSLELLDTPPERDLDDLVHLASTICGTPISLVTLVDADRQFFKASQGIPGITETSREVSFCGHTILSDEVFVVPNASADERFHDNPLVTDNPNIRFYAGAPLVTNNGFALGSLCVIDTKPRELTPAQLDALRALGRQVVNFFELRRIGKQLRRALEAKSEFLRVASHDLKNPLNVVLNAASLVRSSIEQPEECKLPAGAAQRLTASIERCARQMNSLITTYLDAQLAEDSMSELRTADVKLLDLVRTTCDDLQVYAESKGTQIDCTGEPIAVCGDRNRLVQVVSNIVSNAVKYSPPDSVVRVVVHTASQLPDSVPLAALGPQQAESLTGLQDEKWAVVQCRDAGPGISRQDAERLFTRYGKVSARPTAQETSSGLGLHITWNIVQAHGGRVGVYNNRDEQGSTFWFALPLDSGKECKAT